MNEMIKEFLFFGAAVSIMGYELGLFLKAKFRLPIFNPLLISIIAVMIFLSVFHIDYESYNVSARYLSYLLTPATVCLAVPLYQQLSLLKKHARAILAGTVTGVLTTMATVLVLALLFQLTHEQYVTFLPKSITTAIGMGVSEEMGGIVTITVACIIITGIIGNIIAETVCRLFHKSHGNGRDRRSHEQPRHRRVRALHGVVRIGICEFYLTTINLSLKKSQKWVQRKAPLYPFICITAAYLRYFQIPASLLNPNSMFVYIAAIRSKCVPAQFSSRAIRFFIEIVLFPVNQNPARHHTAHGIIRQRI